MTAPALARDLLAVMLYIQKHSGHDFYELVEELDLTLTQLKTLHVLDLVTGEASVKDVGEALGLSFPAASRTVDGLCAAATSNAARTSRTGASSACASPRRAGMPSSA